MATTIKSSGLDFNAIKNNLKTFLQEQEQFADYNFEAAGLSNVLDVLAYNTHYNGLIANFALNESFLGTAQLRSSLVALSEAIGYIPDSQNASTALVNLSVNDAGGPSTLTIPAGFKFTTTVENSSFTFQTIEPVNATKVNNTYQFYASNINGETTNDITIYEGVPKTKSFVVGPTAENDVYIIPTKTLDLTTAVVKVFASATDTESTVYTNINEATVLTQGSTIYVMKESPNGYFELTFGNGTTLGSVPTAGNRIEVTYLEVNGAEANGARTFTPSSTTIEGYSVSVVVVSSSTGGSGKESIESIRKNAPFQYAAQNRMVTASDYSSLILRNFSNYIEDIKSWGGEDNIPADYGRVYVSLKFRDGFSDELQNSIKSQILTLAQQLSVVSFSVAYADPIETYLEITCIFQFNQTLTNLTAASVEALVKDKIVSYTDQALGNFDQSFRRSKMLAVVDDTNSGILSSRASIKMQKRISPYSILIETNPDVYALSNSLNLDYTLDFPSTIKDPLLDSYIVESSNFRYNNRVCKIQNRLGTNTLQIRDLTTSNILVDNIGYYDATGKTIRLNSFKYELVTNEDYIKISAIPANEGSISPERNNILVYDAAVSRIIAAETTSE